MHSPSISGEAPSDEINSLHGSYASRSIARAPTSRRLGSANTTNNPYSFPTTVASQPRTQGSVSFPSSRLRPSGTISPNLWTRFAALAADTAVTMPRLWHRTLWKRWRWRICPCEKEWLRECVVEGDALGGVREGRGRFGRSCEMREREMWGTVLAMYLSYLKRQEIPCIRYFGRHGSLL